MSITCRPSTAARRASITSACCWPSVTSRSQRRSRLPTCSDHPGGKHLEGGSEFLVTDSGVPDHVTELSGVGDSDGFVCCDCCGATGDTVNEGGHHGDCPAVTTHGGGIDTTADTDEITETAEPVTVPVSGVLDKITQTGRNRVTGILPVIERSSCLVQRVLPIGEVTPPKHVGSFPLLLRLVEDSVTARKHVTNSYARAGLLLSPRYIGSTDQRTLALQ